MRSIAQMEIQARCDRDEIRRLREENARLRARAYRATHTTPGTHSTACITWGDDGQGNLSDGGRAPAHACSCGAWPAWLTRERDEARAAITAALDESTATKVLKLRIEELKGRVGELEGDRNYAYRVKHELEAEVARHKRNAECYACEAGDPDMDGVQDTKLSRAEAEVARLEAEVGRLRAITSPGDAAAFEEHMATREAHWVTQVKRLEGRNLHNVTAYSQELTQRTTELQCAEAEVARLRDSMVRHFQEEHLAGDGPEIDRWKREVKRLEGLILEAESDIKAMGMEAHPAVLMRLDQLVRRIRAQREEGQHFKHPTGDYCVWCHSQWPCEEGKP